MNRQPILQTDRLIIRPLAQADYEPLYQIASDPAVWEQHPIHDRWRREVFDAFFADGMASGGALAVAANIGQFGFLFSTQKIKPELSKISVLNRS